MIPEGDPGYRRAMRAVVLASALLFVIAPRARAQDCDCDFVLETDVTVANGATLGVGPGDRVCVMAGERPFLRLQSFVGTADEPVVITNCGGVVSIRNTDRAYAIVVEGSSRYFHLTGTGDPNAEYGFRASCPDREPYPGVGLWLLDKSTNYEADHIEVYETGFAGVVAKTDPLCDGSADQGTFVQRDVRLHHIWAHDTGGEGFYIGSTQSAGHTITCDGASEVHQPHFLEGIEFDHNLIEDTGWDGAQVGMARAGCTVHHNTIRHVGGERVQYQQQGLQIGTFSACEIHANDLRDGPLSGIFVLGAGNTSVYNNVVVDFDADGIYANLADDLAPATYEFHFNTVLGSGESGIQIFGDHVTAQAFNNLVIGEAGSINAGGNVEFTQGDSLVLPSAADALFVSSNDFHLQDGSPARGAGRDLTSEGITTDLDDRPRLVPPSVGAYEYSEETSTPIPESSDGCGCAVGGRSSLPTLAWLLPLALLATRRQRSKP